MQDNPQSILDDSKPLNIELFDNLVTSFYSGNSNRQIHDLLASFEQSPNAWQRAPDIINKSKSIQSKIIALNTLQTCIKTRWKILPDQSKKGIKAFVEALVVKLSQDPNFKNYGPYLTKLNTVLIEIIKREWPHNWPGFVSQVVEVSKTSELVCTNNMNLLRLLSEEAFGSGDGTSNSTFDLTHEQRDNFQKNLEQELSKVFELCMFVLANSNDRRLICVTLKTLCKFLQLKWIPVQVIFESQLIEALSLKYYSISFYRHLSLQCLCEIASIHKQDMSTQCNTKFVAMFISVLKKTLSETGLTIHTSIDSYLESNNSDSFILIQSLTNYLTQLIRYHHSIMESTSDESRDALKASLRILLNLTDCSDSTLFPICCDFWEFLVRNLKNTLPKNNVIRPVHSDILYDITSNARYALYRDSLHDLKKILMRKLPRPKEVLVVQDENGNIIKQEMCDTLTLTLHKQMSSILFILSLIDPGDTRTVIGEKLTDFSNHQIAMQRVGREINFDELNSLCWSIGAVSNSMPPDIEKSFLVVVIKILLSLCEVQKTKDHKAMIASCIMYVVRKYPRFLNKHWKFLQTVVRKLIEFLNEQHPGVQDMSIETLHEICKECGHKFLKIEENDSDIFLRELIDGMPGFVHKLTLEQIENLYGTWAVIIGHETRDWSLANKYVGSLLQMANEEWKQMMDACKFCDEQTIVRCIHLLRTYKGVCKYAGGGAFMMQMTRIFGNLLNLYTGYAQHIDDWYRNEYSANTTIPQSIRAISTLKSEILELLEIFVCKSRKSDQAKIIQEFVAQFLQVILSDYKNCSDKYREYSCLNVCSALIEHLGNGMNEFVPQIFMSVFQITVDMLSKSIDNYPDHRKAFFKFLFSVTNNCFATFASMNQTQLGLVVNCILWAHEHIDTVICSYGIKTLMRFLENVRNSDNHIITMIYQNFLWNILHKLIHIMTDTLHKSILPDICRVLKSIISDIKNNENIASLDNTGKFENNYQFVASQLAQFVCDKFKHLTDEVANSFVSGLFQFCDCENARFQTHCQDFLVQIRSVHKITNDDANNNNNDTNNNNNNNNDDI